MTKQNMVPPSNSESSVPASKIDNESKETTTFDNNYLIILIISLNSIAIFVACGLIGLCIYFKRKWIFQKLFEVDKDGNVYNRNRLHDTTETPTQLFYKRNDSNFEMTNMRKNSVLKLTNDRFKSVSFVQHIDNQRNEYENDPDSYLVPESEPEYHQYLTVV